MILFDEVIDVYSIDDGKECDENCLEPREGD
jgi:hypothetical protein